MSDRRRRRRARRRGGRLETRGSRVRRDAGRAGVRSRRGAGSPMGPASIGSAPVSPPAIRRAARRPRSARAAAAALRADGPARGARAERGYRSSAHPVRDRPAGAAGSSPGSRPRPAIGPGQLVHFVEQAPRRVPDLGPQETRMSNGSPAARRRQDRQSASEISAARASRRAARAPPRAAVRATSSGSAASMQRASRRSSAASRSGSAAASAMSRVFAMRSRSAPPSCARTQSASARLQGLGDLSCRQRELEPLAAGVARGEGGQRGPKLRSCSASSARSRVLSGIAAASVSPIAGQPAWSMANARASGGSAPPRSHAASSTSPDSGRSVPTGPTPSGMHRVAWRDRPAVAASRLSRRQRRLGRLDHREIALPSPRSRA